MMLIFAKSAYDSGKSFGLSFEEIIFYGTFGFFLFGAASPIAASFARKYSRSLMLVIYHFGIGFSAIIAGFSTDIIQFAIAISFIGLFAAIYHPVGIAMLIESNLKVGFRLGINGVFGNMGVAAAPLVTGILIAYGNWRISFIVPGVFCIGYGVVFLTSLKEEISMKTTKLKAKKNEMAPSWERALLALVFSTLSGGFIFGGVTFLIPRYFEVAMQNISTSIVVTGLLASLVYSMASFSQVIVGWSVDRYSPRKILLLMGFGQMIFIFLASQYNDYILIFVMLMAMTFVFGQIPITDTIISRFVPDRLRDRVLSWKFLLNLVVGATVLPICSFVLRSGFNISSIFIMMSMIATCILIAAIILPNQPNHQRVDLA